MLHKAGDYGRYVMSNASYMIQGSDKLDISSCDAMKPISGFDPGKSITLVRNPDYDQATDAPRPTTSTASRSRSTPTSTTSSARSRPGPRLSVSDQPPKPVLQQYLTDPAKKPYLHSNDGDRTWYITMNWAVPPFDDIHVRKAANWVMDKAGILQAWGGTTFGEIATHNIPPIVLGDKLPASEYNPYPSEGNQATRPRPRRR